MSDTNPPAVSPLRKSFLRSWGVGKPVFLVLVVVVVVWIVHAALTSSSKPEVAAVTHPDLSAPAGGTNHTPEMDAANRAQDAADEKKALSEHRSYAAAMSGADSGTGNPGELGAPAPDDGAASTAGSVSAPPAPANVAPKAPVAPPANASSQPPAPAGKPPTAGTVTGVSFATDDTSAGTAPPPGPGYSDAARAELFAAWSGHGATLDKAAVVRTTSDAGPAGGYASMPGLASSTPRSADSPGAAPAAPTDATPPSRKTVLLPAGHGVYGHAVLTANSDLDKNVLVQIDSGPFVGDRVSGTFDMKNDRLIIKFDKLLRDDGTEQTVDAIAVSPETAETGVASSVDEHLVTRIALPAAAAFVAGLGQALQSTNTTSTANGLGGITSFTKLTLPQQLGVAAGSAGQQFGQILNKVTPQDATVKLNKGDSVGVMFLSTVYAP